MVKILEEFEISIFNRGKREGVCREIRISKRLKKSKIWSKGAKNKPARDRNDEMKKIFLLFLFSLLSFFFDLEHIYGDSILPFLLFRTSIVYAVTVNLDFRSRDKL